MASVPLGSSLMSVTGRSRVDRKSTRLNSSHSQISYAVFCLKKKNSPVACHRVLPLGGEHACRRLVRRITTNSATPRDGTRGLVCAHVRCRLFCHTSAFVTAG